MSIQKTNHTPGPWKVCGSFNLDVTSINETTHICNCGNYQGDNDFTKRKQANAKLIAAAPDLLAALERWQKEWIIGGSPAERANNYSIEQQIKEAISKAKGE